MRFSISFFCLTLGAFTCATGLAEPPYLRDSELVDLLTDINDAASSTAQRCRVVNKLVTEIVRPGRPQSNTAVSILRFLTSGLSVEERAMLISRQAKTQLRTFSQEGFNAANSKTQFQMLSTLGWLAIEDPEAKNFLFTLWSSEPVQEDVFLRTNALVGMTLLGQASPTQTDHFLTLKMSRQELIVTLHCMHGYSIKSDYINRLRSLISPTSSADGMTRALSYSLLAKAGELRIADWDGVIRLLRSEFGDAGHLQPFHISEWETTSDEVLLAMVAMSHTHVPQEKVADLAEAIRQFPQSRQRFGMTGHSLLPQALEVVESKLGKRSD